MSRKRSRGKEDHVKRMLCLGLLVAALVGATVWATDMMPTGEVALTISGPLFLMNRWDAAAGAGVFDFDLGMLNTLPATTYTVTDPWLGEKTYTGVRLSDLLAWVGVDHYATKVVMVCSDAAEFVVQIEDAAQYPIMIAYASNNKVIKAGSGGPLKLVYPYQIEGVEALYSPDNWAWYVVGIRVEY
jgi:hypothetical protein